MILEIEYLNDNKSIISEVQETHLVFDADEEIVHYLEYITTGKSEVLDLTTISRIRLESEIVFDCSDYDLESNVVNVEMTDFEYSSITRII